MTDLPTDSLIEEETPLPPREEAQRTMSRYIKVHSMRQTTERRVVLDQAYTIQQPFTAEELRQAVAQTQTAVTMATIYNCLELLTKLGLVTKVLWGESVRYARTLGEPPVQVVQCCTLCGAVTLVEGSALEQPLERVPFVRFKRQATIVCSNGLCAKCRATETRLRNTYLREHWWEEDEF